MGGLIFSFALGILIVGFSSAMAADENKPSWLFAGLIGVTLLAFATFVRAPLELPSGLPKTGIDAGEYKVAFIYVAGENVSVGIEMVGNENERLYLYQFLKSAFDSGSMNPQATKLVVVESGGFRKLVLE